MKAVHCPCGQVFEADTDDELIAKVQQHVREDHPELVSEYTGRRSSRSRTITDYGDILKIPGWAVSLRSAGLRTESRHSDSVALPVTSEGIDVSVNSSPRRLGPSGCEPTTRVRNRS
jgi:Protein of unknown function (DUF1059)